MRSRLGPALAVGLSVIVCLCAAAVPEPAVVNTRPAGTGVVYWLDAGSLFAEGCLGSQDDQFGCMCPLIAASEFRGRLALNLNHQTPPGHVAYEVTIQNWLFTFDDEQFEITGTGYYDTWTDLYGDSWESMTLDLIIYDEEVQFFSGLVADPDPSGAYPDGFEISLTSDTDCLGYVIAIDAARFHRVLQRPGVEWLAGRDADCPETNK